INGTGAYLFQPNSDPTKVFNVLPLLSTDTVTVIGRTKPSDFQSGNEVPFDTTALVLYAAHEYLEDDGSNPGATAKFERLFDLRVSQLKKSLDSHPRILDPRIGNVDTEWREEPF